MKQLLPCLFISCCLALPGRATDSLAVQKQRFTEARLLINKMLTGETPVSYEDAVFAIEDAWWNGMDHAAYKRGIDLHVQRLRALMAANRDSAQLKVNSDWSATKTQKQAYYEKVLANYTIYQYMTSPSMWRQNDTLLLHKDYGYSTTDPMGSTSWENTQVTNLLKRHEGNCFALASLFKIFSDRLQSDARLCTAPGHIYIRHADHKGIDYNVELSTRSFPGTGTLETLTHSSTESIKNKIALRELDNKQAVALCLVYLAKAYEHKFGKGDGVFAMDCAETALHYDDHNLNAMLLKTEVMEGRLSTLGQEVQTLKTRTDFKAYQAWVTQLFAMGYREMPQDMKNRLIKGWTKDTLVRLVRKDYAPKTALKSSHLQPTRYASLSNGLFDETIRTQPLERYGNTIFDTKKKTIVAFVPAERSYNGYDFDPVVFAWNIDPLAHEFPWASPYNFVENNPISRVDPDGRKWVNPYTANVAYWTGQMEKNPDSRKVKTSLEYFQNREAQVNKFLKELNTYDKELYDYVDNLKVMDYRGEMMDVEAVVYYDNRISGTHVGENAVTEGIGPDYMPVQYKGQDVVLPVENIKAPEGKERYGFKVTLFGGENFQDVNLANEAGDIMYIMEYNRDSNNEGGNDPKDDSYWRKGMSGDYSRSVEMKYKERKKEIIQNPQISRDNPYPLKK